MSEQVFRFVRSHDGMTPHRYGEWIRLKDYETMVAERESYRQQAEINARTVREQADAIREMRGNAAAESNSRVILLGEIEELRAENKRLRALGGLS